MSAVADMAGALKAALDTLADVRAHKDLGHSVDPPAVIMGPPTLRWQGVCSEPTTARWVLYIVVAGDSRAMERLWDLVPRVAAAVDAVPDAAVDRAAPGTFNAGDSELPSYELIVECSL